MDDIDAKVGTALAIPLSTPAHLIREVDSYNATGSSKPGVDEAPTFTHAAHQVDDHPTALYRHCIDSLTSPPLAEPKR